MYKVRDDEPGYAFIPEAEPPETNRYGKRIQLVDEDHPLAGKSLNINGDPSVGNNPNRYKQHGFYFNADNCIACHACESACSEKNNLPPHLAFRAVGYVEGGTWPAYRRINISMACNHCDNPVCLKGCPTRAYTKYAEYGAVLQDPDICFGCGYCTWVCPYNAPQLDPVEGQVQKCNMCVDRLEVGLKPACAAACLAGALDFGIIETTPPNREQLKDRIPGFPDPSITHPNIRFQQTRSLPGEMVRTDAMPLRYVRGPGRDADHRPAVRRQRRPRRWNLRRLRSREDPLVIFTLVTQAVVGAFLAVFLGPRVGLEALSAAAQPLLHPAFLFALLGLETLALALSTMHLGKPHRFYRAFNNLRYSPVSREVAGVAVFYNLLGAHALVTAFPGLVAWLGEGMAPMVASGLGWAAGAAGLVALYFMHAIYRIPARPFWNHWQVLTAFYGSMLSLGGLLVALTWLGAHLWQGRPYADLLAALAWPVMAGLVLEGTGLFFHARDMKRRGAEGEAAHYIQQTDFGWTYLARNAGLGLAVAALLLLAWLRPEGAAGALAWAATGLLVVATELAGRALFYVLVIPTTMPGAFFWRNRGFQEHARESGLARMPQVGVVEHGH